jgi:hypothetical protein
MRNFNSNVNLMEYDSCINCGRVLHTKGTRHFCTRYCAYAYKKMIKSETKEESDSKKMVDETIKINCAIDALWIRANKGNRYVVTTVSGVFLWCGEIIFKNKYFIVMKTSTYNKVIPRLSLRFLRLIGDNIIEMDTMHEFNEVAI